MNQNTPTPLIDWPYWGKPFAKTPRGYYCRRHTTSATLKVVLGTLFLAFVLLLAGDVKDDSRALAFALVFPPTAAIFAGFVHYFLYVRPLRPSIREARQGLEPWRRQWLDSERSSLALQQQVREAGYRLEDAFMKAPGLPATAYRLSNHLDMPMPECSIPLDRQEAIERAPHMMQYALSAVLCNLVRIGGPMVVGRIGDAGVLAIFKPYDGYQVWAKVEFQRIGDSLVPRLFTGLQTWTHRYQDRQGTRYPGDMAKIKRHHFKANFAVLMFLVPVMGQILAAISIYSAIRDYFATDRVASFRSELWPWCGDSSDPVIMSGYKQAIPGSNSWIYTTPEAQGTLDSLKRRILEAVTVSLGRTV